MWISSTISRLFDIPAQEEGEKALLTKISDQFFNCEHKWAKSKSTEHMRVLRTHHCKQL